MAFGAPWLLLTLAAIPAVLVFCAVVRRRPSRRAVAFTNLELLASVASESRSRRGWLPVLLLLLALALVSAALAQPTVRLTAPEDDATVVLLVDVSGSMRARDVEPTRLDAAAAAMRTFLDRLPKQVNVGLVQFSTTPDVLSPPTLDRERVRESLGYLRPEAGTAIGDGIALATHELQGSLARRGYVRTPGRPVPAEIVLLSDGDQTQGTLQPTAAALAARRAGIRIDTVALGTDHGTVTLGASGPGMPVPPDPTLMQAIARDTGGVTFDAQSAGKLFGIYSSLGSSIGHTYVRRHVASWCAAAAAVLLLAAVGLARARRTLLV
jgi:Ca-activated chloride channel homolog